MKLINHSFLPQYCWLLCFFVLGIKCLQAAEEQNGRNLITLNFWTKKNNDQETLLKKSEYQDLAKGLLASSIPSQYYKRTYKVSKEDNLLPTISKLVNELKMPLITSWLDLNLSAIRNDQVSRSEGNLPTEYSCNFVELDKNIDNDGIAGYLNDEKSNDWDIIVEKKQGARNISMKLLVEKGDQILLEEELLVYPSTTILELFCYLLFDSNMTEVVKGEFFEEVEGGLYLVKYQSNKVAKCNLKLLKKTVEELNSSEIIFSKKKEICRFYLNRDNSLLSKAEVNTPQKIKDGVMRKWKVIRMNILRDSFLWPVLNSLLPGKSAMDIGFATIKKEGGSYVKLYKKYEIGSNILIPITVSTYQVEHPTDFLLLAYKKENGAALKCLLKKEGSEAVIKEEMIYISRCTYFIEAYLSLLSKADYVVDRRLVFTPRIIYTVEGDSASVLKEGVEVGELMLMHSRRVNADAYIFIMPGDAICNKVAKQKVEENLVLATDNDQSKLKEELIFPADYDEPKLEEDLVLATDNDQPKLKEELIFPTDCDQTRVGASFHEEIFSQNDSREQGIDTAKLGMLSGIASDIAQNKGESHVGEERAALLVKDDNGQGNIVIPIIILVAFIIVGVLYTIWHQKKSQAGQKDAQTA